MSNRNAALSLSTRTVKIYASAFDATARADIAEHLLDLANPHEVTAAQVGLGNADNTADADKPISDATAAALALLAPLDSAALVGLPTAPTAPTGTATTQLATTAFAYAAANDVVANMAVDDTPLADHLADLANPHAVTKAQVGLGNAENTADIDKPVSTATQAAINAAVAGVGGDTIADDLAEHLADVANPHAVTKAQVGLAAVDNTADLAKPVSSAQQSAINVASAAAAAAQSDIDGHQANTSNPHAVTKAQVGLANVDNTSDLAKPVSDATQAAINAAVAGVGGDTIADDLAEHIADIANPHGVTKTQVGLAAVDNTADIDKPVSTAQQLAINAAVVDIGPLTADLAEHLADVANPHATTKAQVGLGNVDNTADIAKPISDPTQIALNLKVSAASPALTGVPTAPTAAPLTNSTQLATTAYTDAAVGLVADAAADAQAAADAAQADATQALADAAAAMAAAQEASSPGTAIALYGETKTGEAEDAVPIDPAWSATSPAGNVIRVVAAVADDPQTVTPIAAIPLNPGRVYEVRWRVQRQVDPIDPLNDSVTCGVQWLTNSKAANGSLTIDDIALVIVDGVQERTARIGIAPPETLAPLEHIAPAGTVYFRPFVDLYGDTHTTDVITIDVQDVTASVECCNVPVAVATPASGATVTMIDRRPLYINNAAPLTALTIRLPAQPGGLAEIGFAHPVTALVVQDAAGVAVAGGPTNAYGPGAALFFRYIDPTIGWSYWK